MNQNYETPGFLQRLLHEQTAKFLQKIFLLPALTVMVFLRRDLGYRLLNPMLSFTLFVIYAYLTNAPMRSPFFAFAAISALTKRRSFWFVSMIFGVIGAVFLVLGFTAH